MAAKATEKEYVVGNEGYLFKEGKIIKTGEKVKLSAEEFENVKHLVLESDSSEAQELAAIEEAEAKAKEEAAKAEAEKATK